MTIASEIQDLQTNLAAAKNAVTAKGGTTGNTGLAGLATEIASIPSSGGPSTTQWGELSYYSEWSYQYSVDPESVMACTVNSIDSTMFGNWMSAHQDVLQGGDGIDFRYEESFDPDTGMPTGEYYWFYGWEPYQRITPENMFNTTGIDVTVDEGETYAGFYIRIETIVDTTSPIMKVVLTQNSYNNLGYVNDYNGYFNQNGLNIYHGAVTGFTFGTSATTTPAGFLYDCPRLASIDMSNATSLTSIGDGFLANCASFNQQITFPNTVTSIGNAFLSGNTSYNRPITIPNTVTTIGNEFLSGCTDFNSTVTLPNNLTAIGNSFLYNNNMFNQPISIPGTVTTIGASFLSGCSSFNQSITIPSGVTTIGGGFLNKCQSFNQPLVFPEGLTNLGGILNEVSNYNQPITIPSTVTSIGGSFLYSCTSFNKPLNLPSGLKSIGQHFLAGCRSFNQPITLSSSITSIGAYFMNECKSMVSVITCEAPSSALTIAGYNVNTHLSTYDSSSACYATGIPIGGSKRSEWLSTLPNRGASPYRKLLDNGA